MIKNKKLIFCHFDNQLRIQIVCRHLICDNGKMQKGDPIESPFCKIQILLMYSNQ